METAETENQSHDNRNAHNHQVFFSLATDSPLMIKTWTTASLSGMLAAVATGTVLSLFLEGLKTYSFVNKLAFHLFKPSSSRLSVPKRVFRSFFHILDVSVAYILMLLVMTFNIYILISVITGAGLGHFFFRPLFFSRINARLRRRQRVLQILHSPSEEQACVHCTDDSSTDHDESNRMSTITSKGKEEECKVTLIVEDTSKAESQQFVVKGKETCV